MPPGLVYTSNSARSRPVSGEGRSEALVSAHMDPLRHIHREAREIMYRPIRVRLEECGNDLGW